MQAVTHWLHQSQSTVRLPRSPSMSATATSLLNRVLGGTCATSWCGVGAMAAAKEAARAADVTDARPSIILGNIHWAAQRHSQASTEYQAALRADPTACPLDLYLKLGSCFLTDGEFEYARNVYVQVSIAVCAAAWLDAWCTPCPRAWSYSHAAKQNLLLFCCLSLSWQAWRQATAIARVASACTGQARGAGCCMCMSYLILLLMPGRGRCWHAMGGWCVCRHVQCGPVQGPGWVQALPTCACKTSRMLTQH